MLIKIRTVDGVAYDLVRLNDGKLYWQRWTSREIESGRIHSHLKDTDIFSRSEIRSPVDRFSDYETGGILNKYDFFFEFRKGDLGSPLANKDVTE